MKFITLQDAPSRQVKRPDGTYKIELTNYFKITVPVNKLLGFAPMWAIPITTFKETLANIFLCAPNYPRFVCVFETDNYVRIDKLQHYRNVMNGTYEDNFHADYILPLANDDLPEYLTEYCLNISKLDNPLLMGSVENIETVLDSGMGFNSLINVISSVLVNSDDQAWSSVLQKYLRNLPAFDFNIPSDLGVDNIKIREKLESSWFKYRYTVLPLILSMLCEDSRTVDDHGRFKVDASYFDSCSHNVCRLVDLANDEAHWSYFDCSLDPYCKIHDSVKNLIIDSKPVLKRLFLNETIGRNEKCPCGSGIKYKKCHGRYIL